MIVSEKQLTPEQSDKIEQVKRDWLAEAEPYLNNTTHDKAVLDGPNFTALAQIQIKYRKKMKLWSI